MEGSKQIVQEYQDAVKARETRLGTDILDEDGFSKKITTSLDNLGAHISRNTFLESGEKAALSVAIDAKVSQILLSARAKFDTELGAMSLDLRETAALKIRLLSTEAANLISSLVGGVEKQLREKSSGLAGIDDEEFKGIVASLASYGELADYAFGTADSIEDAVGQFGGPLLKDLVIKINSGDGLYVKQGASNTLIFLSPNDPGLAISLPREPMPSMEDIHAALAEARSERLHESEVTSVLGRNLIAALEGNMEGLQPMDSGWSKLDTVQTMAIESAYNMGLDAAHMVKMQLLVLKVAQVKGYTLPPAFVLDGGWGKTSNEALKGLFDAVGVAYIEGDKVGNFKRLIKLHHEVLPKDNTEIFLTADEINDPQYKFENKGVYRGLKVNALKQRIMDTGFDIAQIAAEKVFGSDITQKVKDAFPRALGVLQKLTPNKNLQASVLATMIMETGLSSSWDDVGLGRGDRKDYVRYVSENFPRTAAAYNEYAPGSKLETNSIGVMQVNYKTAQSALQDVLGLYYPKDMVIDKLEGSVEFSTVMAFVVYQQNQDRLARAEHTFGLAQVT